MDQKKLNEILKDHEEWVNNGGKKGVCANLRGADLSNADLSGANLYNAYLRGANLRGADLSNADLREANLCNTNLREADLNDTDLRRADIRGAYFHGADFRWANLRGAFLPKGIYATGGAGSEQRYTYYDAVNDHIICGCWNDDTGNHLDSFKKRIEDIYGPDGKEPNPEHYKAYRAAIQYFEACRDAYIVGDCHEKED